MRSSEDIQAGIYLEIMNRKKNDEISNQITQRSNLGKTTYRSTISKTLHDRYE